MSYWTLLAILLTARAGDFLSTWLVTPNLSLETNPIARKLGWRRSAALNLAVCLILAVDVRLSIPVAVSSLLLAARNCDLSAGRYRRTCIAVGSGCMAIIGLGVMLSDDIMRLNICLGFVMYAILMLWFRRVWRRDFRKKGLTCPRYFVGWERH